QVLGWPYVRRCGHRSKSCGNPPAKNLRSTSKRGRRNAATATKKLSQTDSMPPRRYFRAQPPSRSSVGLRQELRRPRCSQCWRALAECKQKYKSRSLSLSAPRSAHCKQLPDISLRKSTERRQRRVLAAAAFGRRVLGAFSCGALARRLCVPTLD